MKKLIFLIGLLSTLTGCESSLNTPPPPGFQACDSRYENCGRPSPALKQEISSEVNGMVD